MDKAAIRRELRSIEAEIKRTEGSIAYCIEHNSANPDEVLIYMLHNHLADIIRTYNQLSDLLEHDARR